jgi:DNA-binding transcriptional LysR family regulator
MNSEPDWDLYRTFLAVLQEGSLSGAARRLGLTQPTVARHVDGLEALVGADLFLRSQRGLVATELALELKPHAEALALDAATLWRTASGRPGEVRGAVRISASEVVGVEHLPPILAGLRRAHPGLVIELVLSNALDDLLQREADIAVRNVEPAQGALIAQRLPPLQLGLFAHRDYIERRGAPASAADLAGHDVIGFDRETPAIRAIVARWPEMTRAAFALRADSDLAQLAAIRAGFGIGLCQTVIAARDAALVRLLEREIDLDLGLWVAMHEDLRSSARHRVVFDELAAGLRGIAGRRAGQPMRRPRG